MAGPHPHQIRILYLPQAALICSSLSPASFIFRICSTGQVLGFEPSGAVLPGTAAKLSAAFVRRLSQWGRTRAKEHGPWRDCCLA